MQCTTTTVCVVVLDIGEGALQTALPRPLDLLVVFARMQSWLGDTDSVMQKEGSGYGYFKGSSR